MGLGQEISKVGNPAPPSPPTVTDRCAEKLQNSPIVHFQAFGEYFGGFKSIFPYHVDHQLTTIPTLLLRKNISLFQAFIE